MGVCLNQYRAAIGLFGSGSGRGNPFLMPKCMFYDRGNAHFMHGRRKWSKTLYQEHHSSAKAANLQCKKLLSASIVLHLLLALSGNVESNPGPKGIWSHDVSICHSNIRSLKYKDPNTGTFERFMHIKCNFAGTYDIITLSETWLSGSDTSDDFKLAGYQTPFRRDREYGAQGYGGVLAWVSNNIACKRHKEFELPNMETLWLECRSKNHKFLVCVIYRTASNSDGNFWDRLHDNISDVMDSGYTKILITGDLNSHPDTPEGIKLFEFAETNLLTIHVKEPTRVTPTSEKILDQFLSNIPNMVKSIEVLSPVSTNDHCTIVAKLLFRTPKSKSYTRKMWDFKNANFDKYRVALRAANFDECFSDTSDINIVTSLWTSKVLSAASASIKHKNVVIRPNDKPWYNGYLRRLCRKKGRLHKIAKCNRQEHDWARFVSARNEYFSELKRIKLEYDQNKYNILAREKKSSKKWWSLIKKVQKSNETCEVMPPIEIDNDILTDDKDKAEAFNLFFSQASSIDDTNTQLPNIARVLDDNFLVSIQISKQDIIDQLKAIDVSKSYGPDGISPIFLKESHFILVDSLHSLFNLSLNLGKVPCQWKQANVVPIHKKDLRSKMNNYRPVSLLSIVGKLMERIVFKYIYNFFKENFVITVFQSGFLPGCSTVTQLLEVYHQLCQAVDRGKEVRIVFLDISKAFDRVWHKGLIFKLKQAGIGGKLLDWFCDYLHERLQRVVINGQCSKWQEIKAGVPQGSVLGPTLFLIFINDITYVVRHCKIRMFADDTCLIIEVDNREETAELINEDLESINVWSKQWLVNFSASKTKSLIVSTKHDSANNPPVTLNGQLIDEVKAHTYLGVKISHNLRWNVHINDISLKARKKLNAMMQFKYKLDRRSLQTMYDSFVRPTMEYAQVVWGGTYDSDMAKLERIQVDALRVITGATARSNIVNLYRDTDYETFQQRTNNAMLTTMYKIVHGIAPQYLCILLERNENVGRYNLRRQLPIKVPLCRLELYKRSFFPHVINLWNSLSANVRELPTTDKLKHYLKKETNELCKAYYYGERWPSVHHARMRIGCSKLNSHLCYNLHVINNPTCECGAPEESPYHYFFECPNFQAQRANLFNAVSEVTTVALDALLYGLPTLFLGQNQAVFKAVHSFIISTHRFS